MFLRRAVLVWFMIIVAETAHGILRTLLLQPLVGDFRARQLAVFSGSLIILAIAVATVGWIGASSRRDLLKVGLLWLALTLTFEIGLGRVALGYSWERIASDYNLPNGGLLPIGLAFLTVTPLLATKIRAILQSIRGEP